MTIQLKNGTAANRPNETPVAGQALLDRDTKGLYMGTGDGKAGGYRIGETIPALDELAYPNVGTIVANYLWVASDDNEGGQWRHQMRHTSYYREIKNPDAPDLGSMTTTERDALTSVVDGTLIDNTTTGQFEKYINSTYIGEHAGDTNGTWNATTRGIRPEFPAAVDVKLEAGVLYYFDITGSESVLWKSRVLTGLTTTSVFMLGGVTFIGTTTGLLLDDLISDDFDLTLNYTTSTSPALINNVVNAVAATQLANAPTDRYGVKAVTWAVGTDGGVGVKVGGQDVIYDDTNAIAMSGLSFSKDGTLSYGYTGDQTLYSVSASTYGNSDFLADITYNLTSTPAMRASSGSVSVRKNNLIVRGSSVGLDYVYESFTTPSEGMVAYLDTDQAPMWQPGAIAGAWLGDTDDTDVTGVALVTGDDSDFASSIGSWVNGDVTRGDVVWNAGGSMDVTNDYSNGSSSGFARATLAVTCEVGKLYTASADITGIGALGVATGSSGSGGVAPTFIATQTTHYLVCSVNSGADAATANFDNVTCRLANADRSVNNNGLQVFSTPTRTALGIAGDSVVAHSGFSSSIYYEDPAPIFDPSTNNWEFKFWLDEAANSTTEYVFAYANSGHTGSAILGYVNASGYLALQITDDSNATRDVVTTNIVIDDDAYRLATLKRVDDQLQIWLGEKLSATGAITNATGSLTQSDAVLRIGGSPFSTAPLTNGALALFRVSETAESGEQIEFSYGQELSLIQGRSTGLAGSSDAIVSVDANEEKGLTEATTSSGLSRFSGLVRESENLGADYQSAIVNTKSGFEVLSK